MHSRARVCSVVGRYDFGDSERKLADEAAASASASAEAFAFEAASEKKRKKDGADSDGDSSDDEDEKKGSSSASLTVSAAAEEPLSPSASDQQRLKQISDRILASVIDEFHKMSKSTLKCVSCSFVLLCWLLRASCSFCVLCSFSLCVRSAR